MARIEPGATGDGLIGRHGDMIYRRRGNVTFTYQAPKLDPDRKFSPKQLAKQELFKSANVYGKNAISDPQTKAMYQAAAKPGRTAYNVAFKDYCNPPEIDRIELDKDAVTKKNIVHVRAYDDFRVASVHLSVFNTAKELVEEGYASISPLFTGIQWIYTFAQDYNNLRGFV
ncbi:MAG: hypothetical protein J7497_15265, partial [Chitinophagaceae bacterium]|nr:hypothetical protein [Chitinophagaceae bacterium]